MKLTIILISSVLLFGMNSCGVITKTRYGNGFKLNIETNLFSKGDDKKTPKSKKPVKIKDIASENEIQVRTIETNDVIDFNYAPSEPEIVQKPISISSRNLLKKSKSEVELNEKIHVSSPEEKSLNAERKPIEPVTLTAAWLFYGSLALLLIITQSGIYTPIFGIALFVLIIAGVILAFIGRRRIKYNEGFYAGKWLARSIILLFIIAFLYVWYHLAFLLLLLIFFR